MQLIFIFFIYLFFLTYNNKIARTKIGDRTREIFIERIQIRIFNILRDYP